MLIVNNKGLRFKVLTLLQSSPRWWPTAREIALTIMAKERGILDLNEVPKLEREIYRELDILQTVGLVEVHDAAAGTMSAWSAKC